MQSFVSNFVSGVQTVAAGAKAGVRFKECIGYVVRNKDEIFQAATFVVDAIHRLYDEPQYKDELDYWQKLVHDVSSLEGRALLSGLMDKSLITRKLDYALFSLLLPGLIKSLTADIAQWGHRSSINLWVAKTSVTMLSKNVDILITHLNNIVKKLPLDPPVVSDGKPVSIIARDLTAVVKKEIMRLELELMTIEKTTIGFDTVSSELMPYEEDLLSHSSITEVLDDTPGTMIDVTETSSTEEDEAKPPARKRRKTRKQ